MLATAALATLLLGGCKNVTAWLNEDVRKKEPLPHSTRKIVEVETTVEVIKQ